MLLTNHLHYRPILVRLQYDRLAYRSISSHPTVYVYNYSQLVRLHDHHHSLLVVDYCITPNMVEEGPDIGH